MTELRLNGKTEDGLYLSLHDNDGQEFTVRVSDTLRAAVNQQRLMAVPSNDEPTISIKEIQRLQSLGQPIPSGSENWKWPPVEHRRLSHVAP